MAKWKRWGTAQSAILIPFYQLQIARARSIYINRGGRAKEDSEKSLPIAIAGGCISIVIVWRGRVVDVKRWLWRREEIEPLSEKRHDSTRGTVDDRWRNVSVAPTMTEIDMAMCAALARFFAWVCPNFVLIAHRLAPDWDKQPAATGPSSHQLLVRCPPFSSLKRKSQLFYLFFFLYL